MKTITFNNIHDFDPQQIFDCGQCFRWAKQEQADQGACPPWRGVVGNRLAEVSYFESEARLVIKDSLLELGRCTAQEAGAFWWNYFDLDRDYGAIKEILVRDDQVMARAVDCGRGIRILNQDRWETLLSFIVSQNNNIPRIKKCIESVAETLGEKLEVPPSWNPESAGNPGGAGGAYYALPSPEALAQETVEDLAACRLGYRDKYLIETAKQIVDGGYCSDTGACKLLDSLASDRATNEEAIEGLRCFCGVGPKVANCVALFCLNQVNSFPLDVWMKRVMNQLYGIPEKDLKTMKKYAADHFTPYGGIAQQYLFYYMSRQARI